MIAWLKLLRLPNVLTAVADVAMGYLFTHPFVQSPVQFGALALASVLLYLSGMVLNDVFDAELDAREQPERPIPSGQVSRRAAGIVGATLLAGGVLVAFATSVMVNDWRPVACAVVLGACIVQYDALLKHTPAGPLLMGACRALNVLLGMSLLLISWGRAELLIASGIGVYVVGVTMFARTDTRTSRRQSLIASLVTLLGGIALLAFVPSLSASRPPLVVSQTGWYLLWSVLALVTLRRCVLAIVHPTAPRVQLAVRHLVHSIIVLDAAVVIGYAGPFWGLAVFSLLFPTMLLTQWLRAT